MNIIDEITQKARSEAVTTTDSTQINMGFCGYRLPCGMCSYLRQMCLKEPTIEWNKVTCEGGTNGNQAK